MKLNTDNRNDADDREQIEDEEKNVTQADQQRRYVSLEERRAPHGSGPCPCCGPYSE